MNDSNASNKCLSGVKVLTFEHALAGPMTTEIMAAYGATVIRIETGTRLDWHRQAGPFINNKPQPNSSVCYLFVNAGKKGITLNLRKPEGIAIAKRLVKWSDVVVENFAGGVMAKMGLGYQDLIKVKPDIIMLSAGIYGQNGPFATVKGHGGPLTALTGFPPITGFPDQPAQFPGFALTDFTAPRASVLAIVAALDYHRRTGQGQYLDAAQMESAIHLLSSVMLEYTANNHEAMRQGNRSNYASPHGVYQCKGENKYCAISVASDDEWLAFKKVLGNPAWSNTDRFNVLKGRLANEDAIDQQIEEWCRKREAEEVMETLQAAGIAAGVVQAGEAMDRDPHLRARGFWKKIEHPDGIGEFSYGGMPVRMSDTPYAINRAPMLGENNDEVFVQLLGMPDEEFVQGLAEGLFE
jgi:benzylsuccinate CoA-transferase BbsF subunit